MSARPLCSQTTAKGKPCRNRAMDGSDRCSSHLGRSHRPQTLTPEMADQIAAMLRAGNYVEVAARAVGVHRNTLHEWLRRGREGDPAYAGLYERCEQARAEGEAAHVAQIARAGRESWQAVAWLLERQYPERWARPSQRAGDEPATADPADDPFAEVDELAEARRRRHGD
jgi:transposase-like protein